MSHASSRENDLDVLTNTHTGTVFQFFSLRRLTFSGHSFSKSALLNLEILGQDEDALALNSLPMLESLRLAYVKIGVYAARLLRNSPTHLSMDTAVWLEGSWETFHQGSQLKRVMISGPQMLVAAEGDDEDEGEIEDSGEQLQSRSLEKLRGAVWLVESAAEACRLHEKYRTQVSPSVDMRPDQVPHVWALGVDTYFRAGGNDPLTDQNCWADDVKLED